MLAQEVSSGKWPRFFSPVN